VEVWRRNIISTSVNRPALRHWGAGLLLIVSLINVLPVWALQQHEADSIPHVSQNARDNFANYIYSPNNKAFAISPGGAWAWVNGLDTEELAREKAIKDCQENGQQRCAIYALNDRIVFDEKHWYGLLQPYSSTKTAAKAETGTNRGMRFPDIQFKDEKGTNRKISNYRGAVTIVHFWGSWCPPCLGELPDLSHFYQEMNKELKGKARLILLQVREPLSDSKQWLKRNQLTGLPLYDSGIKSQEDDKFRLADGAVLADREIARVFPTTYILDKNGIVLLVRYGPIHKWSEYLGFIRHAAQSRR